MQHVRSVKVAGGQVGGFGGSECVTNVRERGWFLSNYTARSKCLATAVGATTDKAEALLAIALAQAEQDGLQVGFNLLQRYIMAMQIDAQKLIEKYSVEDAEVVD